MKWFKHLSGSLNDSFIFDLIDRFGGDGYLVFFGTLELMADEFDINNPGFSTFSIKKLTKNLQLSRQKTVKILMYCNEQATESLAKTDRKLAENWQKTGTFCELFKKDLKKLRSFFTKVNKDHVELFCPRLKELTDEYTQKQLTKKSGQTPDSHRDKLRSKEVEVETEGDKPMAGQKKKDPRVKVFLDWWCVMYKKRFKKKYAVTGAKEGGQIKKLLLMNITWEELQYASMMYMLDDDLFIINNGHSIGLFMTKINKYPFNNPSETEELKEYLVSDPTKGG